MEKKMIGLDFLELTRYKEQKIKSTNSDTRPLVNPDNSRYHTDLAGNSAFLHNSLAGLTTPSVAAEARKSNIVRPIPENIHRVSDRDIIIACVDMSPLMYIF